MIRPDCTHSKTQKEKGEELRTRIKTKRASDLLSNYLDSSSSLISTTINYLDNHPCIMGLRPKTLTEFITRIGINQTQLSFRILTTHLCENEDSNVIYITAKNTFSLEIVKNLIQNHGMISDTALQRVFVYDVITLAEFLSVLHVIKRKQSELKHCLLIVDGLNACYIPADKQDYSVNIPVMTKLFQHIKELAVSLNLTVLIITEQTKERIQSEFTATHTHDERYKQFIDVRVLLQKSPGKDEWIPEVITPVFNGNGGVVIG